ncbi:hypothetical protein QFW77_18280 [Luteimonas sp. RD2P54]|uniref:Uncharacterized protein n=1 Tax=Luteimonas endophytica TaxID=3042023 RepID=A0ABT6JE73_9GAMM|nr:hypothetical protein [Luteimonas endophytica]MDH5824917.1 hypothetical protein [Luteimonas endophytica]
MNPAESGSTELFVQHIACVNNAGFVMWFEIERARDNATAGHSGRYPINQSRRLDAAGLEFPAPPLKVGDLIHPRVHAIAGRTERGPAVRYAPNGQTATFAVTGTTLLYSIQPA